MRLTTVCLLAISLFVSAPATANDSEVEALAKNYYVDMDREGIGAVTRYLHPDALKDFHVLVMQVLEFEAKSGKAGLNSSMFGSPKSIQEIRALDTKSLVGAYASFMGKHIKRLHIKSHKIDILGTVVEGEVKHVLVRRAGSSAGLSVTVVEVLSFKSHEDSWWLQTHRAFRNTTTAYRNLVIQQ